MSAKLKQVIRIILFTTMLSCVNASDQAPANNLSAEEARRLQLAEDAGKVTGTLGLILFVLFMMWMDKRYNDKKKAEAKQREMLERQRELEERQG